MAFIDKIKEKVNTATKDDAEKDENKKISNADAPNIIFVQLESEPTIHLAFRQAFCASADQRLYKHSSAEIQ